MGMKIVSGNDIVAADKKDKGKILSGTVIHSKCNKTIVVLVLRIVKDKLYEKIIKKYKKYIVHDESNECKEGSLVKIQEHRPISATKRWIVVNE